MPIKLLKDWILGLWNEIDILPETTEQGSHRQEPPLMRARSRTPQQGWTV
ncbi:uncharacterized protein G2W53_036533 [Senna tora]|uniref:Uncharacterized protein n=1 Tax=Senna tora TaxID=362788 RepID=A0A834SW41_9FABA|nr:uncharacterized protein G2W53_036533 [Senna tora]